MNLFQKYLCVLGLSACPILELRAAIPWGVAGELPLIPVLLLSIVGNMIPIPFVVCYVHKLLHWMKGKSAFLGQVAEKLEKRAADKGEMLQKYEMLGLFILVAIPLPGTGAWTGALVAAMFRLTLRRAVPTIFCGVTAAGLLTALITCGVDWLI